MGVVWLEAVHPDDRSRVLERWSNSLRSGQLYDAEFRLLTADGSYRWFLVRALPIYNEQHVIVRWVGVNIDIHDRHRSDRERERVYVGLRLLAQTGAVALTSLESVETLRLIALACVSNFASFCFIDMFDDNNRWERNFAHRSSESALRFKNFTAPRGDNPVARVMHDQRSSVVDVDEAWLRATDGMEDRVDAYLKLGVRSLITVPITTPAAQVVGALTCGLDASHVGPPYIQDDLVFVEEVGRRLGSLIENVRLYERERRIAVELQAASLPKLMPKVDHLHLDAEYRPGSDEATIGGDWYDAFLLKDGRIAITVGDVLGHGLRAAVTMTKLRQAMQAAAMILPDPNVMLKVADETLKLIDPDQGFATAIALIYDPRRRSMTFASAGHPGPIMRRPDGRVEDLSSPGIMLGLRSGFESDVCTFQTPPGTSLILFTDGITEATRDMQAGYDRLHEVIGDVELLRGRSPAKALVEAVLGDTPASDDIAVLIATIADPPADTSEQTRYGEIPEHLPAAPVLNPTVRTSSWVFQSSDADSARAVRHSLIAYAHGDPALAPRVDLATTELVLGELLGNVVRHAPGLVTVDVEWHDDSVHVAVSDEGSPFILPADDATQDPLAESGRGLQMIARCTSAFRVVPSKSGGCRIETVIPHMSAGADAY